MEARIAGSLREVGVRRPRIDSRPKVTGATRFAADLAGRGTLHARIVPSFYAHARIRGVDGAAALAVPGVVAVLTASDLPIVGRGSGRTWEPLAREEAVFAGQPVALVVATSEATAEDALELVEVDAERLEPVVDVLSAIEPGSPLARLSAPGDDEADDGDPTGPAVSRNVFSRLRERRGDVVAGFAGCAAVVEGRFEAAWAYQGYLEPHAATAWLEPDGTLVVSAATQGTFSARNDLARIFGLRTSEVRVMAPPIGGTFGSKQGVVEPLVAGAALRLRAPVRLVLTRREDLAATNPAQGIVVDLRIGATASGRFEALEARITYDAGAYEEGSWQWFAPAIITGPYRWPAYDVGAVGVRTNRVPAGNYRAPSGPQANFALETLVDELAERLGLDPVELRAANLVTAGDETVDGGAWPTIGAQQCLERLRRHPLWTGRGELPVGEGVGLAIGVWPGSQEPAAATCRLEPDGTLSVITGVVDISGAASGLATIAAEAFGLPVGSVTIVSADTASAPPTPASNASAITYGSGRAVLAAALDAREQLLRVAADAFEIDPADLEVEDGLVQPRGAPDRGRPVAEFATELSEAWASEHPPVEGHASTAHSVGAPGAAGHLAHVRVDEETGAVELLGYAIAQDVGRALNPALVEGQMLGGTVQSIGRGLHEALRHDDQGQLLTGTFLDYAMPRAAMLPPIDPIIVEVPAPEGPYGARGAGEASILAGPAALANAIAAATGLRLREIPMTPRTVWAAARSRRSPMPGA